MTLASSLNNREWNLAMHVQAATRAYEWSWHAKSAKSRLIYDMRRAFARAEATAAPPTVRRRRRTATPETESGEEESAE